MSMLALLLAGLMLRPIDLGEEIREVRVVDLDADGVEDVVAVGDKTLFLLRGGRAPAVRREAAPLTVLGRGLCGVVREGRFRPVADPFGAWKEGAPGERSLLAALGAGKPALLLAPGDLDRDGRDDVFLAGPEGLRAGPHTLPIVPEASLGISRNETFGVEFKIPVPVLGNWSGGGREVVFHHRGEILAFSGAKVTERVPLDLPTRGREAESMRRNHVLVRDIDGDGRLDLLVVVAKGATGLFASFEATARLFRGGRVYHHGKGGFYRPVSFLKVAGALMKPTLLDLDSDGDLDLVLSTINTSLLAAASGTAPGTYHLFRFDKRAYARRPAWTYRAPVPLSSLMPEPRPPVRFLPDLDGDGSPEALVLGPKLRLLEADRRARFRRAAQLDVGVAPGPLAIGGRRAALACGTELVVVEPSP